MHAETKTGKKPIYDDLALVRTHANPVGSGENAPSLKSRILESLPDTTPNDARLAATARRLSATDRLASQIGRARMFTYAHAGRMEDGFNQVMSSVLDQERSFTQTLASLAPPPESKEKVTPGGLYVLVAAMAGSIVSRNRGVFLRTLTPVAVGISAAQIVLPITSRNVGDLVWSYETRVPVIAANHMRVRGAVEEGIRQTRERAQQLRVWSAYAVRHSRETLEKWMN